MPNQTTPTGEAGARAQRAYIGQMLWLIGAQLNALLGGDDYPVPDAMSVLAPSPAPPDPRATILNRLKGDADHDT